MRISSVHFPVSLIDLLATQLTWKWNSSLTTGWVVRPVFEVGQGGHAPLKFAENSMIMDREKISADIRKIALK